MTLTESVLSVVKQMEEEAESVQDRYDDQVSAALHRYARMLKNVVKPEYGVAGIVKEQQAIHPDQVGEVPDAFTLDGDTK